MEVVVPRTRTVAIIGCGMSGVACAARFRQRFGRDIELTVFESAPSWGGTWHYNRYPGVACDSPNEVYSYSFYPNPKWKHKFPAGAEVVEYYTEIIDAHDLRSAIRVNTTITSCHYDARLKQWTLKVVNKAAQQAVTSPMEVEEQFDFLIIAAGAQANLVQPQELKDFKGPRCHTARWDPNLDLIGKTVAVVGVGSSAAQVVPAIQPYVKHLHVFQRTPEWVLPRTKDNDVPAWQIMLFTWFPFLCALWKAFVVWQYDIVTYRAFGKGSILQRTFESAARRSIAKHFGTPVPAAVEPGVDVKAPLPAVVAGKVDKVSAMTPEYPFGCKRIVISGTYYEALAAPNVTVHHGPLVGTEGENGTTIVSSSTPARGQKQLAEKPRIERTEVDVLICATGFDYQQWMRPLRVYGRSKVEDLGDAWMRDAGSYYGLANAGYPNAFALLGPGTRPGHTGLCAMVEAQVEHIADAIAHVLASNASMIELRPEAQRRATQYVQDGMKDVVYGVGCAGWYQNKSGKVTQCWPKTVWNYQQQLRKLRAADWTVA